MANKTICDHDTPDPWMIVHNGTFYLTFTLGNRVEIWSSKTMEDFHHAQRSVIWHPQPGTDWSADLWAPELHRLGNIWYVYVAGAPPGIGNPGHRTLVLKSSHPDPMHASAWNFSGPLRGLPDDQWSIDATVFSVTGSDLYCCYSGWPLGDHSDTQQDLFLIRLANPEQAIRESLVCISRAEHPWERPDGGRRGVIEGPSYITLPSSRQLPQGFQGIIYSAHGSWTKEYKLAILALTNVHDVCNPKSWTKRPVPLLIADESRGGPFGPGHASFISSPYNDGSIYCIYHATSQPDDGWRNRKARVLALGSEVFRADAMPVCCASGVLGHDPAGWRGGTPNNATPSHLQSQQQSSVTHGSTPVGGLNKVLGEVEKRVPSQYRGAFDKVKRFF